MADNNRISNNFLLNLKMQIANRDSSDAAITKESILKEIKQKPSDPYLVIKLIQHLMSEKQVDEAFKYCYDMEMKFDDNFAHSLDWYNTISLVVSKYAAANEAVTRTWNYWLLLITAMERQIVLNLSVYPAFFAMKISNIYDITNLLFEYDQMLKKCAIIIQPLVPDTNLTENFLRHFSGQLYLHIVSFMFKIEKTYNYHKWPETTDKCLPLLLLAYQHGTVDLEAEWLQNICETTRNLCVNWNRQGAFRCIQAARTLLSYIKADRDKDVASNIPRIAEEIGWTNENELATHIRKNCLTKNWRSNIFYSLYTNSYQISKMSTSYFMQTPDADPTTDELPHSLDITVYEETAQFLYPSDLSYLVYLRLGHEDLSTCNWNIFSKIKLITSNLSDCGVDTLSQHDIDAFLYAAIIESKSIHFPYNYQNDFQSNVKPMIMPYPNMANSLCREKQRDWWSAVYRMYNNQSNLQPVEAQDIDIIQDGLEGLRCVGTTITIDLIILFKVGEIFLQRLFRSQLSTERYMIEERVIRMFKFAFGCTEAVQEVSDLNTLHFSYWITHHGEDKMMYKEMSKTAIAYVARYYFRNGKYQDYIDDFTDIQLPYANYYIAQAYLKLDETNKSKTKQGINYIEKAQYYLNQALILLKHLDYDNDYPLYSIIQNELKNLDFQNLNEATCSLNINTDCNNAITHYSANDVKDEALFPDSSNEDVTQDTDHNCEKLISLENSILKMFDSLNTTKDIIQNLKTEVNDTQNRLIKIENILIKIEDITSKSSAESFDECFKEFYATMHQEWAHQQQLIQQQIALSQMYNPAFNMYMQPQLQRQMYGMPGNPINPVPGAVPQSLPQTVYPPFGYAPQPQQQMDQNTILMTIAAQQQYQAAFYQQQLAAISSTAAESSTTAVAVVSSVSNPNLQNASTPQMQVQYREQVDVTASGTSAPLNFFSTLKKNADN